MATTRTPIFELINDELSSNESDLLIYKAKISSHDLQVNSLDQVSSYIFYYSAKVKYLKRCVGETNEECVENISATVSDLFDQIYKNRFETKNEDFQRGIRTLFEYLSRVLVSYSSRENLSQILAQVVVGSVGIKNKQ